MDFPLTNDELAEAIAFAFERCEQKYVGGNYTLNTEPGKAMLEHLKGLLACQLKRANTIELPPNTRNQPGKPR